MPASPPCRYRDANERLLRLLRLLRLRMGQREAYFFAFFFCEA